MKKLSILVLITLITITSQVFSGIEKRAAIDVGSGGTKVAIAVVDTDSNKIIETILDTSFPVPYQAALDKSPDGTFDTEIRELGIKTFKEIKAIAESHEVQKISTIATSAFRKANNAKEFVAEINEKTGIKVNVITQKDEGEIAFFSALATGEYDPEKVIVWDIGTGSMQMTTKNSAGNLTVYMGESMGSVAFKSYVIGVVQNAIGRESPNPINELDHKHSDTYVRFFGRAAFPLIKEKIKTGAPLVGIGRTFYNSIRPLASEDGVITRKGLRNYINSALNKTDEELNNPFAHVDVTNCILVLAMMKSLHIHEILAVDATTTKGMLIYPYFWNEYTVR